MLKFNNLSLVSSGLFPLDMPPPALALLSGMCESKKLQHSLFDLNIHIRQCIGAEHWNHAYEIFADLETCKDTELLAEISASIESSIDLVLDQKPDLVALTVFSYQQYQITKIFLEHLRSKSDVTVIAGGPGISYEIEPGVTVGKKLAGMNLVNYYVLGEGEYTFSRFLDGSIELGVNYAGAAETWAIQIDDLDQCVFPTYKNFNFNNYKLDAARERTISITGSRGCVRRCTFCDVGNIWKKFRFRSATSIINELRQHIRETGITHFFFTDSLINGSLKQFTELITSLADLKKTDPDFANINCVGQFIIRNSIQHKERMFELMKQAGFDHLVIGVETGSDKVREHMNKKFTNADLDHHLNMSSKYKIKNSLLMFTGYPTETLEDHNETISMLKRYQKYLLDETVINLTLYQPFVLLKNTPFDAMKHEVGITNETYNTYFFDVTTNPDFTVKEKFRRYLELARLALELKYPGSWADIQGLTDHINSLEKFIKEKNYDH